MDASGSSALLYRQSKPLGKLRRRVQDLRVPSSSLYEFLASRPTLDLSHSESARLAVDCLLSHGLGAYREALDADGEVDFLSKLEKNYITENRRGDSVSDDDGDGDQESDGSCEDSLSGCPAVSIDSDLTVAGLDLRDLKPGVGAPMKTSIELHFQSESKAATMRDMVREFVRKAETGLSIVTETFSDVELLFDLLEACTKRNVCVQLLLDRLNLNLFVSMWQELKLSSKNFPKLSVRSIEGQTYCAKTGRKVTGKIAENFIIADRNEVLNGSYSFCWLSWQVHRSLSVILKGKFATPFHQEFHRLYQSSKPVPGFAAAPPAPLRSTPAAQNINASKRKSKSRREKVERPFWELSEDVQNTQVDVKKPEEEKCEDNAKPPHVVDTQPEVQAQPHPQPQVQPAAPQSATAEQPSSTAEKKGSVPAGTSSFQRTFSTHSESSQGFLFQQGHRDRSMKTPGMATGLNAQEHTRGQWSYSPHLKSDADLSFDNPAARCHLPSQKTSTKAGFQFPARGQTSGSEAQLFPQGVRMSEQTQKLHHSQLRSHPAPEMPGATAGARLQPQTRSSQQVKPATGLYWTPTARAGALTRQSSFNEAYRSGRVMGGQLGWRPQHGTRTTALGRSVSMTEPNRNTHRS